MQKMYTKNKKPTKNRGTIHTKILHYKHIKMEQKHPKITKKMNKNTDIAKITPKMPKMIHRG
jgi:hypothetical protein